MSYTDKTQLEKYLNTTFDASLNTQITNWITAVEGWIDNYLGFSFAITARTERYFDGTGQRELFITPIYDSLTVSILDEDGNVDGVISESHLIQYPLNREVKDRLYLRPGAEYGKFPSGRSRVKIKGKHGWGSSVPQPIQLVATELLSEVVGDHLSQIIKSESLGDYSVTYGDFASAAEKLGVYSILDQYRNLDFT